VLVVVDDFSRYSWVFFMATKDEAFTHARDLILRLQNEFPKKAMRSIHSDNGIEFKNTQFCNLFFCFFRTRASVFHFVCAPTEWHC
jgi:IS30 family transposase